MRGTTELLRRATMRPSRCFLRLLLQQQLLRQTRSCSTARCRASGARRRVPATWRERAGPFRWWRWRLLVVLFGNVESGRQEKKGRCGRRFGPFAKGPANHHAAELSETRDFAPANRANSPHSATSAAVPMEKSLIDGEAGNEEPDLGVDDANPTEFPASLFPFSAADERCESRRMSEDMVSR